MRRQLYITDAKFSELLAKNIKFQGETNDGYLTITVEGTSAGVQQYNDLYEMGGTKNEMVGVYRPLSVFNNPSTFATAINSAVTIDHPEDNVGPKNFNDLAVGHIQNVKAIVDDKIYFELVITNQNAIDKIKNGVLKEVSLGYHCECVPARGEYQGQKYNYKFVDYMIINHIALLGENASRASVKILDSKDKLMEVKQRHDGKWTLLDKAGNEIFIFDSQKQAQEHLDSIMNLVHSQVEGATAHADSTPTPPPSGDVAGKGNDKEGDQTDQKPPASTEPSKKEMTDEEKAKLEEKKKQEAIANAADEADGTDHKDAQSVKDAQVVLAVKNGYSLEKALTKDSQWLKRFNDSFADNAEVQQEIAQAFHDANPQLSSNFHDGAVGDSALRADTAFEATLGALYSYKKDKKIPLTPELKRYYDSLPAYDIPYQGALGGQPWYANEFLRQAEANGTLDQWSKVLRQDATLKAVTLQKDSEYRARLKDSLSITDLGFQDNAMDYTINALSSINAKWIEEIVSREKWMHLIAQETGPHVKPDLKNITFHVASYSGVWDLTSDYGNAPLVSIDTETVDLKTKRSGADIMMSYNEIKESAILGINYRQKSIEASAKAFNHFMYSVITTGKTPLGNVIGEGLFNAAGIDITDLGTITVASITGDALVDKIQLLLNSVYNKFSGELELLLDMGLGSKENYMYLGFTPEIYSLLATKRLGNTVSNTTCMKYIAENNVFTLADIELKMFSEKALKAQGVGGKERLVLGARSEDVASFGMPIAPRLTSPERKTDYILIGSRCQTTAAFVKRSFGFEYADFTLA